MGFLNTFLFNHLRFQIAATVVLVVIEILYFSRPQIKILSTRIFNWIIIFAAIYLIFDYASVFSLVFFDSFPKWLVRLIHQGFIFNFVATFLLIYVYLDVISHNQRRLSRIKRIFVSTMAGLSLILISITKLNYRITEDYIFADGPMITSITVIITVLLTSTIVSAIRNFRKIEMRRVSSYVLFAMGLWVVFGLFQLFFPQVLFLSVSISTMLLVLVISLGNPAEYVDKESGAFNYDALKLVISDKIHKKRPFYIINIDMDELSKLRKQNGDKGVIKIYAQLRTFIAEKFAIDVFQLNHHSLTLIFNEHDEKNMEKNLKLIYERFHEPWEVNEHTKIHLNAHVDYVRVPKDTPFLSTDDVQSSTSQLLEFVEMCHTYSDEAEFVHRVNSQLLQNRNRQDVILKILKEAIRTNGIEMYYQPIWNVKEQKFSNCEALVRLKDDKTMGFISPEEFIPVAERNFLIMQLSSKIFENVFQFMAQNDLPAQGLKHMEVNLSAIESVDIGFPSIMKELLEKYQIDPSMVNLEITESIAISSGRRLKRNMEDLIRYGCSFSMDDFGTGYSNLSQITRADFSIIKVDKSLLWPIFEKKNPNRQNAKILLENMVSMILQMGLQIVVEGVETQEQLDYLCSLGVNYIQGYYFSKPIKQDEYLEFLKSKVPEPAEGR